MAMALCTHPLIISSFTSSSSPKSPPLQHRSQLIRSGLQKWSTSRLSNSGLRVQDGGRGLLQLCRAGDASVPDPTALPEDNATPSKQEQAPQSLFSIWRMNAAELRAKAAKWGLAAVLAYGLFDGITYTTFFVLAFLGYEKSTGQNPAANLKALLGVVVLMWGGNNVTRPFRVAGAAALAPVIDKGLKKMQQALKLPNQAFAFMICVAAFASLCFSVVGVLILSRLGR